MSWFRRNSTATPRGKGEKQQSKNSKEETGNSTITPGEEKEGDDKVVDESDSGEVIDEIEFGYIDVKRKIELKKAQALPEHLRNSKAIRIIHTNKHFLVKERDVFNPATARVVNTMIYIVIKDNTLASSLYSFDLQFTQDPEHEMEFSFFGVPKEPPVCITLEGLLANVEQLQVAGYGQNFKELLEWLESYYSTFVKKILEQISKNQISFDGLWFLFQRGSRYFQKVLRNQLVGSQVLNIFYTNIPKQPPIFVVTGEVIKSNGVKYFREIHNGIIPYFDGLKDIQELPCQPITQPVLDYLTSRGKIFQQVALGNHYKHYERFMLYKQVRNIAYIKAEGRVMVDIATFNKMNPAYREFGDSGHELNPGQSEGSFDFSLL